MESVRGEENKTTQQENLDDKHYKLEEMEETSKSSEAGKEVLQTKIMLLQTKVQELEQLIKAIQNDHDEVVQISPENDIKLETMSKYEYELLKCQADEIEQREKLISQIHEQNTRLRQKLTECEKLLREKNLEIKNNKIKLIKFQENDKDTEYTMQKLRDKIKHKDNRIKELGALNQLNEGVIKCLNDDNEKLKEQLEEKDIETREMSNDYKQGIKDNMEEIQEVMRIKEREIKKLTHAVNRLNNELEKYKQINKKVQYAQRQKDNMYLTL